MRPGEVGAGWSVLDVARDAVHLDHACSTVALCHRNALYCLICGRCADVVAGRIVAQVCHRRRLLFRFAVPGLLVQAGRVKWVAG